MFVRYRRSLAAFVLHALIAAIAFYTGHWVIGSLFTLSLADFVEVIE
jgi:hypothetical protein